jgi:glycine cleavage system H protein
MARPKGETVRFQRSRFLARFPKDYLYSPSHFWLHEYEPGRFHVGLTDFATRMLGEIVEFDFEVASGDAVRPGDVVGWMEGFKAVADLYCVAEGVFLGANPKSFENAEIVCADAYGDGWLYAVEGRPDEQAVGVDGYLALLDETIDTMEEKPWKA